MPPSSSLEEGSARNSDDLFAEILTLHIMSIFIVAISRRGYSDKR